MRELIEPIGVLMNILKRHSDKGRRKPKMFPGTVREAAQYWISHQENPDERKEQVTEIKVNGEIVGYETPYHNRLAKTLLRFLSQKEIHQVFIIEAIERGIPWRGDEPDIFVHIVKEGDKFLADPAAYKEKFSPILAQVRS
jgi:hypothetical protein